VVNAGALAVLIPNSMKKNDYLPKNRFSSETPLLSSPRFNKQLTAVGLLTKLMP